MLKSERPKKDLIKKNKWLYIGEVKEKYNLEYKGVRGNVTIGRGLN